MREQHKNTGRRSDEFIIFASTHHTLTGSTHLKQYFLESDNLLLHVEGASGIGKSVIVWNWMYHSAVAKNKSVFWVHLNDTTAIRCVEIYDSNLVSFIEVNYRNHPYHAIDADILHFHNSYISRHPVVFEWLLALDFFMRLRQSERQCQSIELVGESWNVQRYLNIHHH